VCQRGVPEVAVDLFDDRVAAVGLVRDHGVGHARVGGGEERVEAPGVEEGVLSVFVARVEVGDPADHEPPGDLLGGLLRGERGEGNLGDLGAGNPCLGLFVVDGIGVLDGRPGIVTDRGDGGLDALVQADGDRDIGATTQDGVDDLGPLERGVGSHQRPHRGPGRQLLGALQRISDQSLRAPG
jgi:hypothetical protein